MKIKILLLIVSAFIIVSCKKNQKEEKNPPPQNVKVFQIKLETVPLYKEFVGQVYGEKDIPIRARVEGYLEKIHFTEGSLVKKDQLLYTIDSKTFEEAVAAKQSMVSQAKTLLAQSESDLKMLRPLADINAISKREMDIAQTKREAAISTLEAAEAGLNIAKINLEYANINAPISGIIGKTLAREGEFVGKSPNPVILNTVSNISSVRVQFFLSESQYLKFMERVLKTNELEKLKKQENLELILADDSVHKYKGHIDFIDRNIDPSTGAIMLQATFPNPEGLIRPGQYTKVRALVDTRENSVIIPQQSVREVQGQNFVYLVNENGIVENRPVNILSTYKDYFIIKEGLKSGDKIILENVQKLRSKMEVIPELVTYQSKVEKNND